MTRNQQGLAVAVTAFALMVTPIGIAIANGGGGHREQAATTTQAATTQTTTQEATTGYDWAYETCAAAVAAEGVPPDVYEFAREAHQRGLGTISELQSGCADGAYEYAEAFGS